MNFFPTSKNISQTTWLSDILDCPGFGQDRVNFHRTPGRGTAGRADPTWPNRAGYSIPCAVRLGSGGGKRGGRDSLAAWEHAAPVRSGREALWVVRFVLCFLLICIVVVTVPFVCCSVKLPLSRPTSFCLFPFSSAPGEGRGGHVVLLLPAAAKPEPSEEVKHCIHD